MRDQILSFIKKEILSEGPSFELSAEEDLLSTGLIDSMSMMRLIGFLESSLRVTIPPEDLIIENFISVEAMERYLKTLPISR